MAAESREASEGVLNSATTRTVPHLAALVSLLLLVGCNSIARPGPGERAITQQSADLAGFTLIDLKAENVGHYRVMPVADGAGTAGVPGAPPVSLSAGDVLRVRIAETKEGGIFAPLAAGGTAFDNVRVDHKGTISLPYAGRVKVAGLDPQQVEDRLRSRLAGVTFEPQVYVEIVSDRGSSVLVSGEVKSPGRFSMLDGPMTLIDAIARAGGATRPAHQMDVVIRRGKTVSRVPLARVQSGQNMQLRAGDEITLETNIQVFNALGAVQKTGQVEFSKANPTLMDALAQVGGLDGSTASNTGVFVFRLREPKAWLDADNKWQEGAVIFKFDFSKPETMFIAQVFGIRNDDTIYVTHAPAVEWVRSLQPIAMTLTTIRSAISTSSTIEGQLLSGN